MPNEPEPGQLIETEIAKMRKRCAGADVPKLCNALEHALIIAVLASAQQHVSPFRNEILRLLAGWEPTDV